MCYFGNNLVDVIMFDFFANHVVLQGDYSLSEIRVEEELGRGNAHVYVASVRGESLALKQIEIKNDYEYQNFLRQISFMKELSQESQWFVKYHGYLVTQMQRNQYDRKKYAFILMQCAEENLEQFLVERRGYRRRLKTQELITIIEQVLQALASLEEINIAHCDIKPENILIMDRQTMAIRLCDVGSCKVVNRDSEDATILGTVPFLAPQLVRVKTKKTTSTNPFKSDVFSYGLVVLYMVTFKKFKSHERMQIQESAYKEVVQEWIKEARELCDGDNIICEILRAALEFDEFKRITFKELKFVCFNEKKKRDILNAGFVSRLEKEEQEAMKATRMLETSNYFSTQPSNQISLFKNRKFNHLGFTKTMNGNSFKISKNRNSPSPVKRTISCASSSPEKVQSLRDIFGEMKKVVYISEENKSRLPECFAQESDKNFVLSTAEVKFTKAESITLLPSCTLDVFYQLENVQCKRIYIEAMNKEYLGVPLDAPILRFAKIRINLTGNQMVGGYEGLFRIVANDSLELLEIRLTESQASFKDLIYLLDRLLTESPLLQTLLISWQRRIFSEEEHILLTEKVARLPVKKLSLIMNQNYIKYKEGTRWPLPKYCQILYLDYGTNLMNNVVNNLCLSIANSLALKQLYLNFQNNNLAKGEVHMIIKSITSLKTLDRVILNFSFNKIQELKYLQATLQELLSVNYLEIKLHKTEVELPKLLELIECLKELFEFSLKMFKITCDRNMPIDIFRKVVQEQCIFKGTKPKGLRCDILGFDNRYFNIFVKKKDKAHSTRVKGISTNKKPAKLQMVPKMTMNEGMTMSNFNSNNKGSNFSVCYQLYTCSDSFNNYICLTCCENKQMNKYMFYCRFCLTSCAHSTLKDHYFIKVNQNTRCVCAYSGCCKSDSRPMICADLMGADLKKEYQCMKCHLSYCIVCVQNCNETHRQWVKQRRQLSYFQCRTSYDSGTKSLE